MSEIETICRQLCESIDVAMSEKSCINDRNAANQFIEQFKCNQNVLIVLNVSIKLLNDLTNNSILYKHFALQLLQHVIKFNWNSIDNHLKEDIKQLIERWFDLNNNNSSQLLIRESRHLMNASSRCVIEVLMREWPQNWPQFMSHLLKSENQLSLFVIWQLAEDIGVFFLPNNPQRRREMNNEFTNNINEIYSYISKCLMSSDFNLCLISLSTLNALLEWTQFDSNLLNILLQLLCTDCTNSQSIQLKQSICDCLLVCLNRRPLKPNDKIAIQILFTESNINQMVNTVRYYLQLNKDDVENSTFVKRLILVFCGVGQQMVTLSNINDISNESWTQYLQLMLTLFSHQNLLFNAISVQFWFCCLKQHKEFYKNQPFDKSLHMSLLSLIPLKLLRQDYNKSLLGFEFDSIEDFEGFYVKFRADTIDLLRQLTVLDEKICFDFVSQSLSTALIQSNNNRNDWEIIAQLSAAVYNKITNISQFYVESNSLLQSLIDKNNSEDPNVISSQLSCISALTVFLPHISRQLLNEIIKKIFILASFTLPGQTKSTRTKEVKNLRRHACSFFIKISQTYPSLLLPLFFELKSHIDMVSLNVNHFSQMEKCTLYEGLILISNEFENIELQKSFIQELIGPINWILSYNISVDEFITDIGLNQISIDDESFGQKRANILYVVNLILGLLKRIKPTRKIALIPHLFPVINGLFPLISNLNAIWRPEYQNRCHEYYKGLVYSNITEADRLNVLDIPLASVNNEQNMSEKSDAYRMQTFIWSLHENCYSVLGVAMSTIKPEIYDQIHDFKSVLNDLQFLPDWKLRMILKTFLKPLISNCPASHIYFEKILPIISTLLPFLFNKINEKWDAIKVRNQCLEEDGMKDGCEPVESELISDQLNRLLSKEFVEVLVCIINSNKTNESLSPTDEDSTMTTIEVSDNNVSISELGNYLLNIIPNLIIVTVAKSLSWLDTTLSLKTAHLNLIVMQKIVNDGMIKSEEGAFFLFEQIITALSFFGEHEQNQSILLQLMLILYEGITIKLGFSSVKLKLSQITESDINKWNDFDDKIIQSKEKVHMTDKKKKDILRKLLASVIGKNIGQLHKYNKVEIKSLKPMFRSKKNQTENTYEEDICLLFNNS